MDDDPNKGLSSAVWDAAVEQIQVTAGNTCSDVQQHNLVCILSKQAYVRVRWVVEIEGGRVAAVDREALMHHLNSAAMDWRTDIIQA